MIRPTRKTNRTRFVSSALYFSLSCTLSFSFSRIRVELSGNLSLTQELNSDGHNFVLLLFHHNLIQEYNVIVLMRSSSFVFFRCLFFWIIYYLGGGDKTDVRYSIVEYGVCTCVASYASTRNVIPEAVRNSRG